MDLERLMREKTRYAHDERAFIEAAPCFEDDQPLPLGDRTEVGSCGNPSCPYRHLLVEPHPTAAEREQASAAIAARSSSTIWRYHADLEFDGACLVDAVELDFLNVATLDAQRPDALDALRELRGFGANGIFISQTHGDPEPRLLLFCEDLGESIKVLDAHVVTYSPHRDKEGHRTGKRSGADLSFRRLRRASWRTKLWTIFIEALLVYVFGEFAAFLLGEGGHILTSSATLPVWALAIAFTALATILGHWAWLHIRPAVRIARQRLRTLYEYWRKLAAELDAKAVQDPDTDIRDPERRRRPRRRWSPYEPHDRMFPDE